MSILANNAAMGTVNVMFQNGVGDGPQLPYLMARFRDKHNRTDGDSSKRPNKHSVITPKAIQEDDSNGACTPEELEVTRGPAKNEAALDSDTRQLIDQLMAVCTVADRPRWREHRALTIMKTIVENLGEKHRYLYSGMIKQLSLGDRGDDMSFIGSVARTMFADGVTNWGRIASLVAFSTEVAKYMKDHGHGDCVELVSQEISTYLLTDQRDWLLKNKGWDGFMEFFHVSDPESTVRTVLLAVASIAGLGATLAMLIR